MSLDTHSLGDWIPYKIIVEDNEPLVHWMNISGISFDKPFFSETIIQSKKYPCNSSKFKCVSSIENMIEWSEFYSEAVSVVFIFHISRCGSTLLSQLIGLDSKYVVLAEVPLFDEIIRLPYSLNNFDEGLKDKALIAAIKLVGKADSCQVRHLFIKTDSWHILFYSKYRQLFPTSNFVFLFRSPDEVVFSHQKLRGMQAVPGLIEPEIFGLTQQEIIDMTLDVYTAKILEKYLLLFEEVFNNCPHSLLLDYKQGAILMIKQLGERLEINWSDEHLFKMQQRIQFHSKHPQEKYDNEDIPKEIPEYLLDCMKIYHRLARKINTCYFYST